MLKIQFNFHVHAFTHDTRSHLLIDASTPAHTIVLRARICTRAHSLMLTYRLHIYTRAIHINSYLIACLCGNERLTACKYMGLCLYILTCSAAHAKRKNLMNC